MSKADRQELERLVQAIDRQHPKWSASEVERELAARAAVSYGNWREDTPVRLARLRQVQRWRTGARGGGRRPRAVLAYRYIWPMGERQRHSAEPGFPGRPSPRRATHRLFLNNCATETVRELRAKIDGVEVAYEPALAPGGFTELAWTRSPGVRAGLLRAGEHETLRHGLEVEFAVSNGARRAFLRGELTLDSTDGWQAFSTPDQTTKELV